jgi:sulfoxide reductase catalytic subunit YedY
MAFVLKKRPWHLAERHVTPERIFMDRRNFLRRLGWAGGGWLAAGSWSPGHGAEGAPGKPGAKYPALRNPKFNPAWELTSEKVAANYNNFYEFTLDKERVARMVEPFTIAPWPIEIGGLVEKPLKLDVQELIQSMVLEERIYRFRCVEAWAMIVPWTGFPLRDLLEKVSPKPEARFVRFETFNRPQQAPGMRDRNYPWPYTEGLRLDEAMNDLTLVGTGIYGKPLPKQHGAPIRIIVPWKYGYKSIKSIVKIELVANQPKTLWETVQPNEYPFESNVNPLVPHPRWSQATERMIDSGDRVKTQPYNGYGRYVADLYAKR